MEKLKEDLKTADDEYLVSISNKGILKRAYKDIETANIKLSYIDGSAYADVDGVQCVILSPLAASTCTCPSRSICRHIISAILQLKKELLSDGENKKEQSEETDKQPAENKKTEAFKKELSEFPLAKLQKAMKKKYYNEYIDKARLGIFPNVEENTVITVEFAEDNTTVKLISPLEYSACTCHSKELCKHKAAAILTWQIKHNVINTEELLPAEEEVAVYDIKSVHDCAENALKFLEKILSDGLVRTPDDASETAESVAVMCHNAHLADTEKKLREIGNRLNGYIEHSPEFNSVILFENIMDELINLKRIITENDEEKLKELMGEFKSKYTIADTLEIIPLAQRHFSSSAGYEGEIYYFINKDIDSRYSYFTYSDIRPTFYETNRRRSVSKAPWGLYGAADTIMKYELRLTLPKLSGIKISSSNDTKAEEICKPNLNQEAIYERIYTDFLKLVKDKFLSAEDDDSERLVMLMPEKCISSVSDEITQTHNILVEDKYGQCITLKTRYRSDNKDFFEKFVKAGEIMLKDCKKKYVIFGNAYIENSRCCIYPIAIFGKITPTETDIDEDEIFGCDDRYDYFANLFQSLKSILCDLIQCGINTFDLYSQIEDSGEECKKSGLIMLSENLQMLADLLRAKNHTYIEDNSEIIELLAKIYRYLKTGIKKTQIRQAINNLYYKEDN